MNHAHYQFTTKLHSLIEVTLNKRATVLLLDSANYAHYRAGRPFESQGGLAKVSPFRISPPHAGRWHLVIDHGDRAIPVTASARLLV